MVVPRKTSEKGQALIILAGALIALMAFTALAIDGGMLLYDRRSAQNAADAAAMAGAYSVALNYRNGGDNPNNAFITAVQSAATNQAGNNGYGTANGKTVTVSYPTTSSEGINYLATDTQSDGGCTYDANCDNHYVKVVITSPVSTTFLHFIYPGAAANTVTAVAHIFPPSKMPLFGGSALVALAPNGCATANGNQCGGQ